MILCNFITDDIIHNKMADKMSHDLVGLQELIFHSLTKIESNSN